MARRQYRVHSDSNWTGHYGYAFIALVNQSGSGRKFTLRSIECYVHSVISATALADAMIPAQLIHSTTLPLGGEDMSKHGTALDSATAIPSTVVVRRNAVASGYASIIRRVDLARKGGAVGNQNRLLLGSMMTLGTRRQPGLDRSAGYNGASIVEPVTLRQNQSVALVVQPDARTVSNPMRVSICLSVNGKTVNYEFVAVTRAGAALFSVENTSTNPVKLLGWGVMDVGTTDTPTLRVVPIGQLYAGDVSDNSKQQVDVFKMNSTYPNLTALKVYTDIPIVPYGVPEAAISEASGGSPKGMNYLHTKDFTGPMYRNLMVEYGHMKGVGAALPDALGYTYGHRNADILGRYAEITLNPGEGVAIVNSAETAVGVQAAYGGWPSLSFAMQLDDEPASIPQIAISGMVPGSRYRIERVSDSSTVTGGVVDGTGAIAYSYETEDTPLNLRLRVRMATSAPYYKPYEVTFSLTSAGISLPVSQVLDP